MERKSGRGGKSEQPGTIMPRLMQKLGLAKSYQTQQLFFDWERIVGKGIAMHVKPVRLDFHTLFLKADSPVWANQLVFMQDELMQKINGYAASHLVKEIRFAREAWWQKPKPTRADVQKAMQSGQEKVQPLPPATQEEKEKAQSLCREIEDSELQSLLRHTTELMLTRCRVQREQGWHACPSCGRMCPKEEEKCQACRLEAKNELRRRIRRYLEIKPWAPYSEIYEQFNCSAELLREVRVDLLQIWCTRLSYSKEDCASPLAKKLVMLYTAREPENVSDELQQKILKKLRFDLRPVPKREKQSSKN